MRKLNRNTAVAIFVSIGFITYIMFGGTIAAFFTGGKTTTTNNTQPMIEKGVQIQDVKIGTGEMAAAGDSVTVHYVGMLTDGRVFDSSLDRNTPFELKLGTGSVIRGWDEGLVGMRVGGERRLIIAPDYGYGSQQVGPIPPNSVLIFDVKLLDVKKK